MVLAVKLQLRKNYEKIGWGMYGVSDGIDSKIEKGRIFGPTDLDVLIADGNVIAREALRNLVQGFGWNAAAVSSGEDAIRHVSKRRASNRPPEVLLLDWKLPGVDGLTAARIIRHDLKVGGDPIVIMVAANQRGELFASADSNLADAVLDKPATPAGLYDAVSRALRARQDGAELTPCRPRQRLAGVRIQVVDDSEINRDVAQCIFAGEGAEVVLANNGREAVDWLLTHPDGVDIVLMDVQMPVLDGYEATRELRRNPALAQIPVVALTAGAVHDLQELAQSAGMTGFLSKPFEVDAAIALVSKLTGHMDVAAPLAAAPPTTCDLPGLAVGRGLVVWRNPAAYRQYLRKFVRDYADIVARMRRATIGEGAAMAHKLRGAAGNLALEDVAACAGQAQRLLCAGGDVAEALEKLQMALATAFRSIDQYAPLDTQSQTTASESIDTTRLAGLLAQLLAACDTDSRSAVAPIIAELIKVTPPATRAVLQAALENYDFRGAEAATREFAETLNLSQDAE